jgi:hypothetical protein
MSNCGPDVCPCGKHTRGAEAVSVGREIGVFEWIVTFPDLPIDVFDGLDVWIAEAGPGLMWGKWTVRLDDRVSAAAIRGERFADLAALVRQVEDWHAWCGATVQIPPLPAKSPRWRRLAKACAEASPGDVSVTVAWSLDGYGLDHGTTVVFVDGHYAAEIVPLLDPGADDVPF